MQRGSDLTYARGEVLGGRRVRGTESFSPGIPDRAIELDVLTFLPTCCRGPLFLRVAARGQRTPSAPDVDGMCTVLHLSYCPGTGNFQSI